MFFRFAIMSFDELYARWASLPINSASCVDTFRTWLDVTFEALGDYVYDLDELTDELSLQETDGLFTADEFRFALQSS